MIRRIWIGRVDINVHGVGAFAGFVAGLIDADSQPPTNRGDKVAVRTQEKRLRDLRIANATDQRAPPGVIEWQNPKQVLEATADAIRTVAVLGVGIVELTGRGDDDVFSEELS